MKLKLLSVLTISLTGALAACQTTTLPSQPEKQVVDVKHHLKDTLQAYTWSYQPKETNKPIVLSFQDDRLGIHAGCNGMGTSVEIADDKLKTGHVVGTMRACEPALMKQEQFASALFQNREVKVKVDTKNAKQPVLTVFAQDGQTYQFVGQKVAQTRTSLAKQLDAYTWSYQPTNSKTPVQLSFNAGQLSIYSGCNRMGTSVEVKGQTFSTGMVVSTQMACEGLMEQEQFVGNLFNQQTFTFNFTQTDSEHPVLNITTPAGKNYQFKGTAIPETRYQGQAETIFLEISPETKACVGVAPQQCLQVREIKYDGQGLKTATGAWELFYSQIEGFEHQANQRVVLRVKRFTLQNPAADQSRYAYVKDMVVEQELIK